jgi:hypothetical protein
MTTLRDQLDQIARLNEKATQGEYFTGIDDAHDTIPHKDSGLALIDNGTQSDWPVARLCEWPTADFLCALVNYYRSGALQRLAELAEDGERYRWLKEQELKVCSLAVHCRVYDGYHFGVPGHKLDAAIDSARAPSIKEEK